MQVSIPVGILIIIFIWSLPVAEVWLIARFIEWQEKRKRTFGGVVVGKGFAVRLDKLKNSRQIKEVSADGSREVTIGYHEEGI